MKLTACFAFVLTTGVVECAVTASVAKNAAKTGTVAKSVANIKADAKSLAGMKVHEKTATMTKVVAKSEVKAKTATAKRMITKVVKMLQEMLDKSKSDGVEDRVLYAKFKCWCDMNIQKKEASIEKLNKLILVLEAKIAEIMADNGKLSLECSYLTKQIAAFESTIKTKTEMREKEHTSYVAEEKDYTLAIEQCQKAIETLAEVGADQTMSGGQEHKQFMAGMELSQVDKASVHAALFAASEFATKEEKQKIAAFIQAPFTGTYSAQSGEVVGILKNMLDTFKANKDSITIVETKAISVHVLFLKTKLAAIREMKIAFKKKQGEMAENDEALASLRTSLEEAKAKLADDEEFLAKTRAICKLKAEEYAKRQQFRSNEEAAIAQAISILNSDAAFETFGKSAAGSSGLKFIQLDAMVDTELDTRNSVLEMLNAIANKGKSLRLAKIAVLLQTGNPFTIVLEEIGKVIDIIDQEAKADKDNLDWCNSEREENDEKLEAHHEAITQLEQEIDDLHCIIGCPETGLIDQIAATEESLKENHDSQVEKTQERGAENKEYQTSIKNCVAAQEILHSALKVLKDYYASMEGDFLQQEPSPPSTWDSEEATKGGFEGQKKQGGAVIEQLEFILEESEKEETTAHDTEREAQHEFEDEMADLKKEEADLQKSLAELNVELSTKKAELKMKEEDLSKEVAGKIATEDYLLKIKPGCDFITENYETREESRATEKKALKKVRGVLKSSPAYKAAVEKAEIESFGECKDKCIGQKEHAECKACLAKVTVPGYCAGHPDTPGC